MGYGGVDDEKTVSEDVAQSSPPERRRYVRAIGSRLRVVFFIVLGLVALLGANSAYLASITFLEWLQGETYHNYFYQLMLLRHLLQG